MWKHHIYSIIISAILIINFFSFVGLMPEAESSFETLGTTNYTQFWYVAGGQSKHHTDETITAVGIQVNSTGYLNLTNCVLTNAGNFLIHGNVKFVNVTLVMNCATNGQYSIDITSGGEFTATDSTITSFDKTTRHNAGQWWETYGNHYNFTVFPNAKMTLTNSNISHVGGDPPIFLPLYGGGIRIRSDDVLIDNCNIFDSEVAGVFITGNVQPTIKNSRIWNNSFSNIFSIEYSRPIITNNLIKNSPAIGGWGVYFYHNAEPVFTDNTIENITWGGIRLHHHANATIDNNIIRNCTENGIDILGIDEEISPIINNNHIYNNFNGIAITPYVRALPSWRTGQVSGNISNNLIEYNNNSGIFLDNYGATTGYGSTINSTLYNNTVRNNERGVAIWEAKPDLILNDISYNNLYGLYILENSDPLVKYNTINENELSGIILNTSSPAVIYDNTIQNNYEHGILSLSAEPAISLNNISMNNLSGIFVDQMSSSFDINGNEIKMNGYNGIYLNRSSPRILGSNLIEGNRNGIGIYNSSNPTISANNIKNNIFNGVLFDGTTGTLNNNNNIFWNKKNGVLCINNANPVIGFSTINQNHKAGVSSQNSRPRIINSLLDGNLMFGINSSSGSNDRLENSTIINSGVYDYYLNGDTHPYAINSSYSKGSVFFGDSISSLTGQWYFHINTTDFTGGQLASCETNITELSADGKVVWAGLSDAMGYVRNVNITKYIQTKAGTTTMDTNYVNADRINFAAATEGPFSGERNFWVDFSLVLNKAPTAGTYMLPTETHNTTPTLSWTPGVDPEGQNLWYRIKVGTTYGGNEVVSLTELNTPSYQIPAGKINHNSNEQLQTFYVTIIFDDRDGGTNETNGTFNLVNEPPTKPLIELTPSEPTILDTITCTITTPSIDNDTNPVDNIKYTYQWLINGQLKTTLTKSNVNDTSYSITSGDGGITWRKHDRFSVSVHASDGYLNGNQNFGKVQLLNIKPTVNKSFEDLSINEDESSIDEFYLYDYFKDPDDYYGNPFTSTLDIRAVHSLNLTVIISPDGYADIIPDPNWYGQETITFIAEDSDNEMITNDLEVSVLPVNDLPKILTVGGKTVLSSITLSFDVLENEQWFILDVLLQDEDVARGENDELFFEIQPNVVVIIEEYPQVTLKIKLKFLPDDIDVGTFTFELSVRDSADENFDSTASIKYIVTNMNDAPVITKVIQKDLGITKVFDPDQLIKSVDFKGEDGAVENQWFNFTVEFTDEDLIEDFNFELDDKVRFKINTDTGDDYSVEIQFKPTKNDIGEISVNFTVLDLAFQFDVVQVIIDVKNINDPPQGLIYKPQDRESFFLGSDVLFQGDVLDPDLKFGDIIDYTWTSNRDGKIGNSKEFSTSELRLGWHIITFTVTDSGNSSNVIQISILINTLKDQDADQLSDEWELEYFDKISDYGPFDDPDKDGYDNLAEMNLGTDPTNPSSLPTEKKGEIDDSIIMYAGIVGIIILLAGILFFIYILRTQRKKDVVGWDWVKPEDKEIGILETLPGYEVAKPEARIGPPGVAERPGLPPAEGGEAEEEEAEEAEMVEEEEAPEEEEVEEEEAVAEDGTVEHSLDNVEVVGPIAEDEK
jgi:hypothetical protein